MPASLAVLAAHRGGPTLQAEWAYWLAIPVAMVLASDTQASGGDTSHVVEAMAAVMAAPRPRLSDKANDVRGHPFAPLPSQHAPSPPAVLRLTAAAHVQRVQAFAPAICQPTSAESASEIATFVSDADAVLADHIAARTSQGSGGLRAVPGGGRCRANDFAESVALPNRGRRTERSAHCAAAAADRAGWGGCVTRAHRGRRGTRTAGTR